MAESDAYEGKSQDEEPADLAELDYDYRSVQDKITAGLFEEKKGDRRFTQQKYEAA